MSLNSQLSSYRHHHLNTAKKGFSNKTAFIGSYPRPTTTQVAQTKSFSWKTIPFIDSFVAASVSTVAGTQSPPEDTKTPFKNVVSPPKIPGGWYPPDVDQLRWCYERFPNEEYGLHPAAAILVCKDRNEWVIECGSWQFYYWNDDTNHIWQIKTPQELPDIIRKLDEASRYKPSAAKDLEVFLVTCPDDPNTEFEKDLGPKWRAIFHRPGLVDQIEEALREARYQSAHKSEAEEDQKKQTPRRVGHYIMGLQSYDDRLAKAIEGPSRY
ncbi:uncharacterized protein KY384_007990 [Bacidia gigantensis]|uniref:uncharacterized protein n=1 Tax=Bacidia gigantensis TaxID=2732470 RepID=UPI001D0391C1|nr:uncharacterized protein KY384_007990 [Bacidia gigantensis]KAG8527246.1 hypothetical protein KY384_007990 [Bacidia gigantensis]